MSISQIVIMLGVIVYYVVKAMNQSKKNKSTNPKELDTSRRTVQPKKEPSLEDIFKELMEKPAPPKPIKTKPIRKQHQEGEAIETMRSVPMYDIVKEEKRAKERLEDSRLRKEAAIRNTARDQRSEKAIADTAIGKDYPQDLVKFDLHQAIISQVILERKYF